MKTLFHVKKVYLSSDKKYIVLEGMAKNEVIKPNMYVRILFNKELSMESLIHSVEEVDKCSKTIKLLISCEEEGEIDFWLGINIVDEILEVDESRDN